MNILRTIEKKVWDSFKYVVAENAKYKDLHKGETCLIFGNGGSLKYYNFDALPKLPAIGCSYSLADKRSKSLDMKYCMMTDSYLLYPYRIHSYERKIQRNLIGPILKKIILSNKETLFFTSLTNYFSFFRKPENLNYFYHFGNGSSLEYDMAGIFGASQGALSIMLGAAKYLGFSKAIVLGCDYLGSPCLEGHFYADSVPSIGTDKHSYWEQIKKIAEGIEVFCIFPKGIKSNDFNSASFEEYFHYPEVYQSNTEIIYPEYLEMMRRGVTSKQIWL